MLTNVELEINRARTKIIMGHAFFARIMISMDVIYVPDDDPEIDTMATDGAHLFINKRWTATLNPKSLIGVLVHEFCHKAYGHHYRRGNRDPYLWNCATDYAINIELKDCGFELPEKGLIDPAFRGMRAETIYELIVKDGRHGKPGQQGGSGDTPSRGGGDPGQCGRVLDAPNAADPAARQTLENERSVLISQAAGAARAQAKREGIGSVPAGLQEIIDNIKNSSVDWRPILFNFANERVREETSWKRPNKRHLWNGVYLPSLDNRTIGKMVVFFDTSGSVDTEAIRQGMGEVVAAWEQFPSELWIVYADTQVHRVDHFSPGDEITWEINGRGGTAFADSMQWLQDNVPDAACAIYFTDMGCSNWGEDPGVPILWAVYGDEHSFEDRAERAPFGESVFIDTTQH